MRYHPRNNQLRATLHRTGQLSLLFCLMMFWTTDGAVSQEAEFFSNIADGSDDPPDRWDRTPFANIRSGDEIWLISSRHMRNADVAFQKASLDEFCISQSVCRKWNRRSWCDLLNAHQNDTKNTVVFVHGNRTDTEQSHRQGWETYEALVGKDLPLPPVRLIIFDWPSDKAFGQLRDIRVKARLAKFYAFYYAQCLRRLDNGLPIGMIGYSYGGRMTVCALHLLGGGKLNGRQLCNPHQRMTSPLKVTFVVPAIRNDCLCADSETCHAYDAATEFLLVRNSKDPLLKYYRFLAFDNRHPALGFSGVPCVTCLSDGGAKLEQINAVARVGADHSYYDFVNTRRVPQRMREIFFDMPPPTEILDVSSVGGK